MCKRKPQNQWSWLPFLILSVGAVSTSLAGQFEPCPNCEVCQGCPYHVNGDCITSPRTFGYYHTNWRRWPGESEEGLPRTVPNLEDIEVDVPDPIEEDELTITPRRRFGSGSRPAPGAAVTPVLPPLVDDVRTNPFRDDPSAEDLNVDIGEDLGLEEGQELNLEEGQDLNLEEDQELNLEEDQELNLEQDLELHLEQDLDLNFDEDDIIEDEILAPQTSTQTRGRFPLGKSRSTVVSWQSRKALRGNSVRKKTRQRSRASRQVVALEPVRKKTKASRYGKNPLRAATRTESNATPARNRLTKSNPLR